MQFPTYKVKVVSPKNSFLVLLFMFAFFGATIGMLPSISKLVALVTTFLYFALGYLLWQKFAIGRTAWTIDHDAITIIWTKKIFLKNCENMHLKWTEVKNISKRIAPNDELVKIKLISGETIKFYHYRPTLKDDFEEMFKALDHTLKEKKSDVQQ